MCDLKMVLGPKNASSAEISELVMAVIEESETKVLDASYAVIRGVSTRFSTRFSLLAKYSEIKDTDQCSRCRAIVYL